MTTLHLTKSIGWSPLRLAFLLIPVALACFGLSPIARAVTPAPGGGYGGANTAEGTDALFSLTSGVWNVAVGFEALHSDTTGNQNTATGYRALFSNLTGDHSTAYGSRALYNNTTGNDNVATGFGTLFTNVIGNRNTGVGFRTLTFNNADDNTAIGWNALYNNRTGVQNTAIGSGALFHGSGSSNTATGSQALNNNDTGSNNNAVGAFALFSNTTGALNEAMGSNALLSNVSGIANVAIGDAALNNADALFNTAVGFNAGQNVITGFDNIYLGDTAGTLDNAGVAVPDESGVIRIGSLFSGTAACFINGIYGKSFGPADMAVRIGSDGKLGTVVSSRRFKHDIKPMDKASEVIMALKPVTFHYNNAAEDRPASGLIAEDVAEVSPDLVIRDKEGKPLSVRYEDVNVMLLNEFLKEHKKAEELEGTVASLVATVKEQAAQIQKVSAQIEVSKPAAKVVVNKE